MAYEPKKFFFFCWKETYEPKIDIFVTGNH